VTVKDSPGFIVIGSRRHYYWVSSFAEKKSAILARLIALLRSAGFKLGPFELMDLIGNDVNLE